MRQNRSRAAENGRPIAGFCFFLALFSVAANHFRETTPPADPVIATAIHWHPLAFGQAISQEEEPGEIRTLQDPQEADEAKVAEPGDATATPEQKNSEPPAGAQPTADDSDTENANINQAQVSSRMEVTVDLPALKKLGPFQRPFLIELHGEINFSTQKLVRSGIERAKAIKADLVVLEVNSPGGGAAESMEIADMLAGITWAPTVAYVSREATSGGALSAFGCQTIVMEKGTTIGDIGVIQFNPIIASFEYAPAKIRSILVAKARALCQRHGRAADLAEAMVDEYAVVYQNQNDPSLFRLVSAGTPDQLNAAQPAKQQQVAEETLPGGWRLIPESRPGRFLTLTDQRAMELGISQASVSDFQEFEKLAGVTGPWRKRTYGMTDRIVDFLNSFWITGLLLIVGVIALFVEISAPGISVGGLIALLCFSLFFWSHFAGGTAGWLEVTLFLMGVVFLLAELFIIPGFGVAGIMGIGLVGASLIMACLDFIYPETPHQWGELTWTMLTVTVAGIGGVAGIFGVMHYMGDLPVLRRFTLQPPEFSQPMATDGKGKSTGDPSVLVVASGRGAGLKVGDHGVSESVLRPAGRARFGNRSVDVLADSRFIDPDRPITIIDVRANRIIVAEKMRDENNEEETQA